MTSPAPVLAVGDDEVSDRSPARQHDEGPGGTLERAAAPETKIMAARTAACATIVVLLCQG